MEMYVIRQVPAIWHAWGGASWASFLLPSCCRCWLRFCWFPRWSFGGI